MTLEGKSTKNRLGNWQRNTFFLACAERENKEECWPKTEENLGEDE